MTEKITIALFIVLLAILQTKVLLWSGQAPDLLLAGLIALAGSMSILELLVLSGLGYVFLAGPLISRELMFIVVIVATAHFLRIFIFGRSPFLAPIASILGILAFYLGTVGWVVFSSPLFLLEVCLVSVAVSFITHFLLFYLDIHEA